MIAIRLTFLIIYQKMLLEMFPIITVRLDRYSISVPFSIVLDSVSFHFNQIPMLIPFPFWPHVVSNNKDVVISRKKLLHIIDFD